VNTHRLLTPSLFAAAGVLFLLPFFSVSCAGPPRGDLAGVGAVASDLEIELTGVDLLLERVPDQLEEAYRTLEGPGTARPLALALGALVAGGILLSGLPRRAGGAAGALLGVGGIALLVLVGSAVGDEARARVQPNGRDFIEVTWEVGAWAVAVLLGAAAAHGAFRTLRGAGERSRGSGSPRSPAPPPPRR
jgi:hypothetical protein